jgi:hypothetical protein
MTRISRPRDPLEPIASTVGVLSGLTGALLTLITLTTVFGSGSLFGFGEREVCATGPVGLFGARTDATIRGLSATSRVFAGQVMLCDQHPSVGLRLVGTFTTLPSFLLFLGFLLLVHRLVRAAQTHGIYSSETVRRVRSLGWYVLVGDLAAATLEAIMRGGVFAAQLPRAGWATGLSTWHTSLSVLLAGIGVITFARVMAVGATMREDLEGTV